MKKIFLSVFVSFLFSMQADCQHAPIWTRNMDVSPDSASLYPEKTVTDVHNNILVLSSYAKSGGPFVIYKIFVNRYDSIGNLLWNFTFDNNGSGNPRGFDITVDDSGNCYIAGGFMMNTGTRPLLMKLNAGGVMEWIRDSTSAFQNDWFRKVIIRDDLLYLCNGLGVAVFDTSGSEKWSHVLNVEQMEVDRSGRMIATGFLSNSETINRFDLNGNLDFSDSTILASRIAVDTYNNIYLLSQWPGYELVKLDSNGVFQWSYNSFPPNISFGDQGFEVLTDYTNDIHVVGIVDTMYKFQPNGNLIWKKSMDGLDTYHINATITYMNFLAVAGSYYDGLQVDVMVALYDINGNRYWYGIHDSNGQQEYSAGLAIDYYGIYVLEDSMSNSSLLRFDNPYSSMTLDFNAICVDSIWYEPGNPSLINVRVFNGNMTHINYPVVQIVSPTGDTISNPNGAFNLFAHLGNDYSVYQDTITITGITDFSNYSFAMSENIFDTTGTIYMCNFLGLEDLPENSLLLFPNPVSNTFSLALQRPLKNCKVEIISVEGKVCKEARLGSETLFSFEVSDLSAGLYILRITGNDTPKFIRFIKH